MAIFDDKVTTAFELPGQRVVQNCGIVRGIIVRSRSIVGSIGAGLQTLFGGNISLYTELCERAREDAYQLMLAHAREAEGHSLADSACCAGHHRNLVRQWSHRFKAILSFCHCAVVLADSFTLSEAITVSIIHPQQIGKTLVFPMAV